MTTLTATLSEDSLSQLESALRAYSGRVRRAQQTVPAELGEKAASAAREACPSGWTGQLKSSIGAQPRDGGCDVVAASEHAAFVEFGTGYVGSGSMPSSMRDLKAMAEGGYVVDGKMTGSKGWFYPKGGEVYWTQGQPGRGFMAAGAEEARRNVADAARRAVQA